MTEPKVRVRIAPSPTGYMHVGTARTAIFNWLFARQQGGSFILRIEDTDRSRYVPDSLDDLTEGLRWLGLEPDEGPDGGGSVGPYLQTERLELYGEHVDRLLAGGHAYRCFCSAERLEQVREERRKAKAKVGYDRHCRDMPADEVTRRLESGEPSVVRLKMPLDGATTVRDVVRGDVTVSAEELEDVVLVKSDGYPTYHLAVVVDDHLMGITHVLRADEWVPSAPIQVRLYEALGWDEPTWVHVPLVLNASGSGKLSKRKSVDKQGRPVGQMTLVREFRKAGYLPEAMFNYLALLGWTFSGDEDVFTRDQALERFRLGDIHPSPAAWNSEKLDWMNGEYIRGLDANDLGARILPFLNDAGLAASLEQAQRMAPLVQERLTVLGDAVEWLRFFWAEAVHPEPADLVPKKLDMAGAANVLAEASSSLDGVEPWEPEPLEAALRDLAERLGLKAGVAFGPVRVAVTGQRVAPPLFDTLAILGRDKTLERVAAAHRLLEAELLESTHDESEEVPSQ